VVRQRDIYVALSHHFVRKCTRKAALNCPESAITLVDS